MDVTSSGRGSVLPQKSFTISLTEGICPYCLSSHPVSCLRNIFYQTFKVFGTAYGIKSTVSLLMSLVRSSASGPSTGSQTFMTRIIHQLRTIVINKDTFQFSSFLAFTSFLARFTRCILARYRKKDDKMNALVAGTVSGLGILLDNPARRQSLVLYFCIRAIHSLAHTLVRLNYIPNIISPSATRLWFGLANSFIIYAFIMEPAFLDKSYYRWILKIAGVPHEVLEWTIRDPTWARMFATNYKFHNHHQHNKSLPSTASSSISSSTIPWPAPGVSHFNIGPCNPPVIHHTLAGRVDLPTTIRSSSLTTYLSIDDPSVNQILSSSILTGIDKYRNLEETVKERTLQNPTFATVTKQENDFLRSLSNQLWKEKISNPSAVPSYVPFQSSETSAVSLPYLRDVYHHQGKHHHHLHSALLTKNPAWLHASMLHSLQDPRAYRRCDTVWHVGHSCLVGHTVDSFPIALKCLRVYTPVHVLPVILFKYKELFTNPVPLLTKTSKGIFWSTAFLTGYVWLVKSIICFFRTNRQKDDGWQPWVAGLFSFPSLLLENHHRATELMLYCAPKGLAIAYGLGVRKGYVSYVRYWDILIFMIAMACFAVTDRNDYGTSYKFIMNYILGPDKTSIADLPFLLRMVQTLTKLRKKLIRNSISHYLTFQELIRIQFVS